MDIALLSVVMSLEQVQPQTSMSVMKTAMNQVEAVARWTCKYDDISYCTDTSTCISTTSMI